MMLLLCVPDTSSGEVQVPAILLFYEVPLHNVRDAPPVLVLSITSAVPSTTSPVHSVTPVQ